MKIKELYIQIQLPTCCTITVDYKYAFRKKAYHIINYINRICFEKGKHESLSFNRIGVNLNYNNEAPYIFNKTLIVPIYFNKEEYDNICSIDDFRFFIFQCIKMAIEKGHKEFECVPREAILSSMENLKNNNFINEWIYKKIWNRKDKIKVQLSCSVNERAFQLKLSIYIDDQEYFNDIILTTEPDKVAYYYKFNAVIIKNNTVIIKDRNNDIFGIFYIKNRLFKVQ